MLLIKTAQITKRTRSVLVVYKDKIIAEKYDTGFDKNSKILGLVDDKKHYSAQCLEFWKNKENLILINPAPIPEWTNDKRKIDYNKRFVTHEFRFTMGRGLQYYLLMSPKCFFKPKICLGYNWRNSGI